MNRFFAVALLLAGLTVVSTAQAPGRQGQAPAQSPRPLVGETLPIGGDIARTIHFYHDLLGLQCRSGDPRARLGWYDTRPFLEDMYGVVGGQLRNVTFLVPGSPFSLAGEEMQIEPIEFNRATGKPLGLRPQDPGASRMIFRVTDIDKLAGYIKQGGAKVVTTGGVPIAVESAAGRSRAIVFDDGNGFLVELVQPDMLPAQLVGQAANPPRSFVYGLDTTVAVADIEKSAEFFRDVLGLKVTVDPAFHADPNRLRALGLAGGQYKEATIAWPDRTPQLNLVQFSGINQKTFTPLVAEPSATMMRLFVSDLVPVLDKVKASPDAKIMNVSGGPSLQNGIPWLVVRLPGGSTYLQIVGLANGRVG